MKKALHDRPPVWLKLDNAAKIYPAASSRSWMAMFRLSATLDAPIDPVLLEKAQESALKRFPHFRVRLRRGLFWFYLEQLDGAPPVQKDVNNPCVRMNLRDSGGFMFRVRYYDCRIAVEIFHVLTDGTGGLSFLLTLVAEYLRLRDGLSVPRDDRILDCGLPPEEEQIGDAFLKHARKIGYSAKEKGAYQLTGKKESRGNVNITAGTLDIRQALDKAHGLSCSLTELLASVLVLSADEIQRSRHPGSHGLKPVKVSIPVNLRRFYGSRTLRNFSSYLNVGIDPNLGEYTLEEVIGQISASMALDCTEKKLNAKFSENVNTEKNIFLRFAPLFIKTLCMKIAYRMVGDRLYTTSLSNLGKVVLPEEMAAHVRRLDFILGPLQRTKVCAAALSYKDQLILNFTRTIQSPELERGFFTRLVKLGLHVRIESNRRW